MRKEHNYRRKLKRLAGLVENEKSTDATTMSDHPAMAYLDEAMASLSPADRHFLMLRYYDGYKVREIATLLGKSETAARKQSERAMARLTRILKRRGMAISAASLVAVLSGALIKSAPVGLIASITKGAAATSATLSLSTLTLNTLQTMTYGKQITLTAAAVAVIAAIPIGVQTHRLNQTRAQLHQVQASIVPDFGTAALAKPLTPSLPESSQLLSKLEEEARASGHSDAEFLRDLLTRESRPPHSEITDFIGTERSLAELQTMFHKVLSVPLGQHQQAAARKIMLEMGKRDGKLAVELAASIEAPALRTDALGSAYIGWGTHDPAAAWAYPKTLPPEEFAKHPFKHVIEGAAIGEMEAGELRDFASSHLIQRWALSEPHTAREWMEANVDISKNDQAIYQLARAWSQVNPVESIDWLSSIPRELQKPKHYEGLFERWLNGDQVAAAKWLAEAEPSPLLDSPFEQYVDRIRYTDPAGAMEWATTITDAQQRTKVIEKVAEAWRSKDPDGLRALLQMTQREQNLSK